jgi:hypothetical protein
MISSVKSADESLFTTLYHSGVGWMSDILETEVFIDVSIFGKSATALSFTSLNFTQSLSLSSLNSHSDSLI